MTSAADSDARVSGNGEWVVRPWCVWAGVALLVLGGVLNVIYLFNHCPLELSEDEAHYWLWAQHLDYGYYSKPPGIAWVLWAAQWVGGVLGLNGDGSGAALMPVLRMPAVVFGMLSGLLSMALARRVFRDDRVGLAVLLLSAAVPMFAVGSLLITIDSPMYLCWAGTVYCLWSVVSGQGSGGRGRGRVFWLYAAGVCAAAGMMFKPVLIALPLCAAVGMWWDGGMRRALKTWHAAGALGVMMLSQVPVVVWNANHNWVTFRHIITQGGFVPQGGAKASILQTAVVNPLARMGSYLAGQAGGMGGLIFLLLVLAVIVVGKELRAGRGDKPCPEGARDATRWVFLLSFFLPLWGFYLVMNLWKGTELNWPAASYFTGMALLAGVVVKQWHAANAKVRRDWRGWSTATVLWGMLLTGVAMNLHRVYPLLAGKLQPLADTPAAYDKSWWNPRKWDPSAGKLRGMQARADAIEAMRREMTAAAGSEPLIITGRYDMSSSLSFYLPGHPFVYCIMSSVGGRQSQYDVWPGLSQQVPASLGMRYMFAGRPAILVGLDLDEPGVRELIERAFTKVGPREVIEATYGGVVLRRVTVYRAWGFREPPERKGGVY